MKSKSNRCSATQGEEGEKRGLKMWPIPRLLTDAHAMQRSKGAAADESKAWHRIATPQPTKLRSVAQERHLAACRRDWMRQIDA